MLPQQINGWKPNPESLVENKVKVKGVTDEKGMTEIQPGNMALGDFKRLYVLSIAQITACVSKYSFPVTYFRITLVFIKIANFRTPAKAMVQISGVMSYNLHFKQALQVICMHKILSTSSVIEGRYLFACLCILLEFPIPNFLKTI